MTVSADISVHQLVQRAVEVVKPKLEGLYPGFQFDWNLMSVVRQKTFTDIIEDWQLRGSSEPYLRYECLVKSGKKDGLIFRQPKSPIALAVLINLQQWSEMDAHAEEIEFKVRLYRHWYPLLTQHGIEIRQQP